MISVTEIAHNLGLLDIPDGILLRPQDIMQLHRATRCCVVVSGTQGEPMSALSRVAVDNHKNLSVEQGDTVALSARIIPGNEKAICRMMNHMAKRGADIHLRHDESADPRLRPWQRGRAEAGAESGSAAVLHSDSRRIPADVATRPLAQHLRSAGLEETFVLESGETLEIDHAGRARGAKVTVGRVCIDSGILDDVVEDMVIRDRRHLSEDGFVLPIIAINKSTGRNEGLPEIVSRGFVSLDEVATSCTEARQVVARTLEDSSAGGADRLGRDAGEDPCGPAPVPEQADPAASV